MLPKNVMNRFIEKCPAAVMTRATLENLVRPERLDLIFDDAAQRQYSRELLFSQVTAIMVAVATRTHQSVRAAYLEAQDQVGVSLSALYDKLNGLEPGISAAMVRETAADAAAAIDAMPRARRTILPERDVYLLDGNHLAGSEHRLAVTRVTREAVLPGQTLALLDAQRELISDLVPCEDGHTQERALLPELLERLKPGTVIVADRNFCTTKFLFGMHRLGVFFVIRQHASTLTWKALGSRRPLGRIATGRLYEQDLELTDPETGETMRVRRITVRLDRPTENGDTEIHILTTLPGEEATAQQIAEVYRARWTIEGAFQKLTDILRCEVETLGYPRAALFSFATAVLAFNIYAVVKAALRSVHGADVIDQKLSDYHLMNHVAQVHAGMEVALAPSTWQPYWQLSPRQLAGQLIQLAKHVDLTRYPKTKRGPKKPKLPRKSGSHNHHVATARLLENQRC
jgi:hypothetical protein